MAKKEARKIPVSGGASALKHNPFGALAGVPASAGAAPTPDEPAAAALPTDASAKQPRGRLILRREKKHRGGKTVVVVAGLRMHAELDEATIDGLAHALKQHLGCGGTVEACGGDRQIVLQGDQPARVAELLRARGFRVEGVTS